MNLLVVARYEENLDWLNTPPAGWTPLIIEKGRDMPNRGREAASYLFAIDREYRKLPHRGRVAFVQGNPFDHSPDLLKQLARDGHGFQWLGPADHRTGPQGEPHHPGLPIAAKYETIVGRPFPGYLDFAPGGQFMVPTAAIHRRPRRFWRGLCDHAQQDDMPWVLERLWEAIFTS